MAFSEIDQIDTNYNKAFFLHKSTSFSRNFNRKCIIETIRNYLRKLTRLFLLRNPREAPKNIFPAGVNPASSSEGFSRFSEQFYLPGIVPEKLPSIVLEILLGMISFALRNNILSCTSCSPSHSVSKQLFQEQLDRKFAQVSHQNLSLKCLLDFYWAYQQRFWFFNVYFCSCFIK